MENKKVCKTAQQCFAELVRDSWSPIPEGATAAFYSELCDLLLEAMDRNCISLNSQLNIVNRLLTIDNLDMTKVLTAIRLLEAKRPHHNFILGSLCRAYCLYGLHETACNYIKKIEEEQLIIDSLGLNGNDSKAFQIYKNSSLIELGEEPSFDYQEPLSCAMMLRAVGRYEEGRKVMETAVRLASDDVNNLFHRGWFAWQLGDTEDAFQWFERVLESPNEDKGYYCPFIYCYYGMKQSALNKVHKLLENEENAENLYCAAEIYSLIGETSEAFSYLKKAFAAGLTSRMSLLSDPALRNLYHTSEGKNLIQNHIRQLQAKDMVALEEIQKNTPSATLECSTSKNGIIRCHIPVQGRNIQFVIDTGMTDTVLNNNAPVQPSMDAYSETLENWNILYGKSFKGQYATILGKHDEPLYGSAVIISNTRCRNTLGMASLANFRKIALRGSLDEQQDTIERIPFKWIDGLICFSCQILTFDTEDEGKSFLNCVLDTGTGMSLMPVEVLNQIYYPQEYSGYKGYYVSLSIKTENIHTDMNFYIHDEAHRPFARIGLNFINQFDTFIIDTVKREIVVKKNDS